MQRSLATDLQSLSVELRKKQSTYLKRLRLQKEVREKLFLCYTTFHLLRKKINFTGLFYWHFLFITAIKLRKNVISFQITLLHFCSSHSALTSNLKYC
jgi:hypothetical protein